MGLGEEIAEQAVVELRRTPGWGGRISRRPGESRIRVTDEGDLADAMVELRPEAGAEEVAVWVALAGGYADLSALDFVPRSASVVRWGKEYVERGLTIGFTQHLLGTALAGEHRRTPVAGGRKADGSLELWIEASPTGEVLAAVDTEADLGTVADLRWSTDEGDSRLLLVLIEGPNNRRLGLARLDLDPSQALTGLDLLVHRDLDIAAADEGLLARSASAAVSEEGRDRWQSQAPGEVGSSGERP